MQSSLHLAIIMDGNGRWAQLRGLPRLAGHRAGERALRLVVEAAPDLGIRTLTAYAFSSDNWKRPPAEVSGLMLLLETHLAKQAEVCLRHGARRTIDDIEAVTRGGARLHLRLAIDYSSRDALMDACHKLSGQPDRQAVSNSLDSPDVDLLIRTGGEQRLSDFLLWECAYAELLFTPCLWPDFGPRELDSAVAEFRRRERRFGGLLNGVSGVAPATDSNSVIQSRG
jgi:undecaprenyl diphosphate synthase